MNQPINTYRGNTNLKGENTVDYISQEEYDFRVNEIIKCKNDIIYFAENYYTIVSIDRGKEIISLYPKQKELLKCLVDNNRTVVLASRQSGKSSMYCIFSLWLALFNPDKKILIVANKEATALEIVSRIRLAYELIPNWLKCGVKVWNKGQIIFGNDSAIEGIATSADSARGKSCSILIIDECAFISPSLMESFYQSVYPIVSSGKNSKVIMVSTPNGVGNLFYETYENARLGIDKEGWKPFRMDWWDVPDRDEKWKEKQIASFNNDLTRFQQEFGNAFFGSSYTLLKTDIIQKYKNFVLSDKWFKPKETDIENTIYKFKQWFKPEKNNTYLIGGDIADGIGNDSSIILVFDITNGKHIKQVASFNENTISTVEFSYVLVKLASIYNNAHIAVEANGIGRSILDSLESIYSYENVINYGGTKESGIFSHVQTKANACIWARNITSLIEIDIYEKLLVAEMEYFEKKLGKFNIYQAVSTKHDDFMMSFIWALFCLQEEIIDNYYNVERYETTKLNINIPTIIRNYNGEYFSNPYEANTHKNVDSDIDNIYKNLVNGSNKSKLDEMKHNTIEEADYDIVYDENTINNQPMFGDKWF